jgi:hypothetical protein
MQHNQNIFESLFNRSFSDTGNKAYLEELAGRHPYFSPAQFFLLEKLQDDEAAFEKQAVKTNILFNNPHWLHFQLTETGITEQKNEASFEKTPVKPVESKETEITIEATSPARAEIDDLPDNTDEPSAGTQPQEKEIEPLHIELKMPVQNAALEEAMLFEPMHLVDYFASQGIKLSDEVQPADKLGKQLKSFTEWLKTMKKVHVEDEAENPLKPDINVQVLAENSNVEAEVVTEAMAEVFARQGKIGKAGEVYQKLSLLNPAKSTYFAAKLENLKGL